MLDAIASAWWWLKPLAQRQNGQVKRGEKRADGQSKTHRFALILAFFFSLLGDEIPTYALCQGFTLVTCNSMVRRESHGNAPEQAVVPAEQGASQPVREVVGADNAPPVSKVQGFSA